MDRILTILKQNQLLSKGVEWVLKNSKSNTLPYHNFNHLLTVVKHCYYASIHHGLLVDEALELLLAALFHDVNHSGGEKPDSENIEMSKDALRQFLSENDFYVDVEEVCNIINSTQYPYVMETEELSLKQSIIRDCDLMQVLEDNWIQQNMIGLSEELSISMEDMINGQTKFLDSVSFITDYGKKHNEELDVAKSSLKLLKEIYGG
tara:strand:- start:96 stop:713 length:618 start_codon:yes stop_codon:yes gene_type:complete